MAICPKCRAEIDHLNQFAQAEIRYRFSLDIDGSARSAYLGPTEFDAEEDFECPECGELLCHAEETALNILKGEIEEWQPPNGIILSLN